MILRVQPLAPDGSLLGYEQKSLEELVSPEERAILEAQGNSPLTLEALRRMMTGLHLKQHFPSNPVCVARFERL